MIVAEMSEPSAAKTRTCPTCRIRIGAIFEAMRKPAK
jgi:hypothetical protein